MSGAQKFRPTNAADSEVMPGSKARSPPTAVARKPSPKPGKAEEKRALLSPSLSAPLVVRRQEVLLRSNLSLDASFSSDASTDSFCSRASTGRIGRSSFTARRTRSFSQAEKAAKKLEKIVPDGVSVPAELAGAKRRCAWVTANTDPCYAAFHDEEWGVPVHDDKKLFELLVLSGALAELTWPAILSKRHIFREVFLDFDPVTVSKLNEKKITAPGSAAISLLSEGKLRAIIENAREMVKVIDEFGSFDRYCWSFVNHKPILSRFRYPRQVPVRTSKADMISKDLVRRGFRSVGPTVVYTFMQASGMTNDHLITCYRFEECAMAAEASIKLPSDRNEDGNDGGTIECNRMVGDEIKASGATATMVDSADIELLRKVEDVIS